MPYIIIIIILAVAVAALALKVYTLKLSAKEIADGFEARLREDTNLPVFISARDKDMARLANGINTQLELLRQEHNRYVSGDTELKTAITNVSHDIRTPLTAICGYLDMMKPMEKPQQIERYLDIISERALAMKQLTEELFRYSVMISDDAELKTKEVLINRVLEDSIMGYYGALMEHGITPTVQMTETTVKAMLNEEYLSRIFSNLLNNAVKYSDGDLDIVLSDSGEITFSNSAKNLSAVEVEQLFDRFYTVEAAHHSTGLGLSISRTLTERMGGIITAEYSDGRLSIRIKF